MQLPSLLPQSLSFLAQAHDDLDLLNKLIEQSQHFILFFENGCLDETWAEEHGSFMHSALRWVTERYLEEKLSLTEAATIARLVHEHASILVPLIPLDVSFKSEGTFCEGNSLLLSTSSEFFQEIIHGHHEVFQQENAPPIPLQNISIDTLQVMITCAHRGTVEDLWKKSKEQLIHLLRMAATCKFPKLMTLCEEVLKRYIKADNVIETMILAHQESWDLLRESCFERINDQSLGIQLHAPDDEYRGGIRFLSVEFHTFNETTLNLFNEIKDLVTHLVCGGDLPQDAVFKEVLLGCKNLIALDISRSHSFSVHFFEIPRELREIDLSHCFWLTDTLLKRMIQICPHLKRIGLSNDIQLTHRGFAELQKLQRLVSLDISRCHQIGDEDFLLIFKACSSVKDLNLEECISLRDRALLEVARQGIYLENLNISRCNINDGILVEILMRCQFLRTLNISKCLDVSERGLSHALTFARNLLLLNVKKCSFSSGFIAKTQKSDPKIKIVF